VDGGRFTVDGGRFTVDGGRFTVDGGRFTVDGGRFTVATAGLWFVLNGQASEGYAEFIIGKLRDRTRLHQLEQGMFGGVPIIFNTKLVSDLARRETLFGVAEQKFEDFDLEFLSGQFFAAVLFFLGHRFGKIPI
jgi:hypothetical protein